ncbi:enoyl-CoA delta isomerase 1, peroxisomal-like [Ipomoea triloba]|uniref:enoyl-CoA delta isomerase 1, peroxisomal-like n=1 Tax=Ipomoea triloba TaxID=35885 RepID=UPI00125D6293|nr:enoyl-CoA delta isomerase 1, peroxisomal-like [Ipomoea triloba]
MHLYEATVKYKEKVQDYSLSCVSIVINENDSIGSWGRKNKGELAQLLHALAVYKGLLQLLNLQAALQTKRHKKKMCTLEKRGNIFVLTLTDNDEHRLHPVLINSISAALRQARAEATGPSVLITTAQGKFFCNGYNLNWLLQDAARRSKIMCSLVQRLVADFFALPMPTIAALTGHACGGGFGLALCHDYILMWRDRGFLCMNELDIGRKLPAWFFALMKHKIASPSAQRDIALRATMLTGDMALQKGIVHSVYNSAEETFKAAEQLGLELVSRNWNGKIYAEMRTTMFAEVLHLLQNDDTAENETVEIASRL